MRFWAALLLIVIGTLGTLGTLSMIANVQGASVQTDVPQPPLFKITTTTGAQGHNQSIPFEVSGSRGGVPLQTQLYAPFSFGAGQTDTFQFYPPASDFCDWFQFKLTSDDWDGTALSISVDDTEVWHDDDLASDQTFASTGVITARWDDSSAYRQRCAESLTPVEVTLSAAPNQTAPLTLYLQGDFSASPYAYRLLQTDETAKATVLDLDVPLAFCQIQGWQTLPATAEAFVTSIAVDGVIMFMGDTPTTGGRWDGSAAYQDRCSDVATPENPDVLMTLPPDLLTPIPTRAATTESATNDAAPVAVDCPNVQPSRLAIGMQASLVSDGSLRSSPSVISSNLGAVSAGDIVTIIAGPACTEGQLWWQAEFDGVTGWLSESGPSSYGLEPVS